MEVEKIDNLKTTVRFATGKRLDAEIDQMVAGGQDKAAIALPPARMAQGQMDAAVLHFNKDDKGNYHLDSFTMTFTPHRPILHETIGTVSTRDLDERMSKAKWQLYPSDAAFEKMTPAEEQQVKQNASLIKELINLSSLGSKSALKIQEQLVVKHLAGTEWAQHWPDLEQAKARYYRPTVTQDFPTQYHERYNIYEAAVLLSGGEVRKRIIPFVVKGQNDELSTGGQSTEKGQQHDPRHFKAWVSIDFENKRENGQYWKNFLHREYFEDQAAPKPKFDLGRKLEEFDLLELRTPVFKQNRLVSMEAGKPAQFHYTKDGKEHEVYITANPKFNTLTFMDADGKMVKHDLIPRFNWSQQQTIQASLLATNETLHKRIDERLAAGTVAPSRGAAKEVQEKIDELQDKSTGRGGNRTGTSKNKETEISK